MVIFTLYGYIGMATFYLVSQWLAQYGQFVVGLPCRDETLISTLARLAECEIPSAPDEYRNRRQARHNAEHVSQIDIFGQQDLDGS